MKVFIDQSGKIEDTSKPTVLAFSNSEQYSILITAKTKRQIQEIFRRHGLINIYIYITFSAALYFLIDKINRKCDFIIDNEYPGKDKIIISTLKNLLNKNKKPEHYFSVSRIGNNPKVHYAAKNVLDKKKKADKIVSLKELLKTLKMTDGRLRGCITTLVDARPRSIKKHYQKKHKKSRGKNEKSTRF